jgi:hypothetical protein
VLTLVVDTCGGAASRWHGVPVKMALKFLHRRTIMWLIKDHIGITKYKQMIVIIELYLGVVDQIIQELNSHFDELNMEFLICIYGFKSREFICFL